MARWLRRGIHPLGKKESTRRKPLVVPDISPKRIIIPLRTPCGVELIPTVLPGQRVKWGQQVAMPDDVETAESSFLDRMGQAGVPVFSGISGIVRSVAPAPHPLFGKTTSILIENDFKNTQEQHTAYENPDQLSQEEVISLLRKRGLRGMARDTRPVHTKVMEGRGKIDTLIVNASECEPYLTSDHRLLLERQELTIAGSKLLAYAMGATEIVMALQGDKLDAIEELEKTKGWDRSFMRVRTLPTRYPLGEEKQVIAYVTGKELLPHQPCHTAHCGVFNIATVCAVGEAILKGMPQTHRAITMAGGAVQRPRNFWVPIGTPFECIIDNAEGFREPPALLLLGGPMSGTPLRDVSAPILVNSSGLLGLTSWEVPKRLYKKEKAVEKVPCIRCGHCMAVCPQHLRPNLIYQSMNHPKKPNLSRLHPESCISCGCCNYRCPAHLPLAQTIQMAQDFIKTSESGGFDSDIKIYDPSRDRLRIPTMSNKGKAVKKPTRLVQRPENKPNIPPPPKEKEKFSFKFPKKSRTPAQPVVDEPDLFELSLTQKIAKLKQEDLERHHTSALPNISPEETSSFPENKSKDEDLLAEEGADLLSEDVADLLAEDGADLLSEDVADLLAEDGADLRSEEVADLLAEDGADLRSEEVADLLAEDGADLLSEEVADLLEEDGADLLSEDVADLLAEDGADFRSEEVADFLAEDGADLLSEEVADLLEEDGADLFLEEVEASDTPYSLPVEEIAYEISEEDHRILVETIFDLFYEHTPEPQYIELSMESFVPNSIPEPAHDHPPEPQPSFLSLPPLEPVSLFEEVPLEEWVEPPVPLETSPSHTPLPPLDTLPSLSMDESTTPSTGGDS